jgi:hypothetical protein
VLRSGFPQRQQRTQRIFSFQLFLTRLGNKLALSPQTGIALHDVFFVVFVGNYYARQLRERSGITLSEIAETRKSFVFFVVFVGNHYASQSP